MYFIIKINNYNMNDHKPYNVLSSHCNIALTITQTVT